MYITPMITALKNNGALPRGLVIAVSMMAVTMFSISLPRHVSADTVLERPTLSSPTPGATIATAYILFQGTATPGATLWLTLNNRDAREIDTTVADDGSFSFYWLLNNSEDDKRLDILLSSRDSDSGEESVAEQIVVYIKKQHHLETYTGAAVLNSCNKYNPVSKGRISAFVTTKEGRILLPIGLTRTNGDGTYKIKLPANSFVKVKVAKRNYKPRTPHTLTFNTATGYTNGHISNHMYLCKKAIE